MKRLIILLVILLPLSAMAQTPTFESLFNEYSTKEKCTTINISNAMLRSMEVNIDAEYMQVIAVENRALIPTFITQAKEVLSAFEVIMSVNSEDKAVMIYQHTVENGSTGSRTFHFHIPENATPGVYDLVLSYGEVQQVFKGVLTVVEIVR